MNKKVISLIILLGLSPAIFAVETNLQDQINTVKEQIKEQEQKQEQLRKEIASKDEEVANLKKQLEELEKKIGGE